MALTRYHWALGPCILVPWACHEGLVMAGTLGKAARHPAMPWVCMWVLLGCSIHVVVCHDAMGKCMAMVLAWQGLV